MTSPTLAAVRPAFFVLLFVNIVFFGWSHWVDRPHDATAAITRAAVVPSLELTQGPPKPAAPALPPDTRCRSIGPFADAGAASPTADALRALGLQPRPRNVDTSSPDGYWVYVEDLKDAAARRKVITALNASGIKDAVAMSDETERVSVGIFADQRHAVHRAEQVQELGFKPVLSLHQKTVTNAWLDVDLKPNETDPAAVASTTPPPANSKAPAPDPIRVMDCPAKPATG
jgi:hypothetical protein